MKQPLFDFDLKRVSREHYSFKERVGQSPVECATRWRMQVAGARLRNGIDSVAKVAASLGYLSDAAFGATFRRVHGKPQGNDAKLCRRRPAAPRAV